MGEIKIAIAGVGNCASSLIQGLFYYKNVTGGVVPGLMHPVLGGYKILDIKPVVAFDIDARKVGRDLSEAIFAKPNCTKIFCGDVPKLEVLVQMAPVLDGVAEHMKEYPEDKRFVISSKGPVNIVDVLRQSGAEVLINYMPVGSQKATELYANACLSAGVAMINCVPVFIASDAEWAGRFEKRRLPIVGDDVKSQVGATIIHRVLAKLFSQRGVEISRTYQLNTGGNTDFLNMLERSRLELKRKSKTEAVQSQLPASLEPENIHIGPSDYIPWLLDNKVCFLRIEGKNFGDVPLELELRLSVEDSPNSAGITVDAIRCCKLALDRPVGGVLESVSAYFMKHPIKQYSDEEARQRVERFIAGEIER
ncbi:MAG: inositol-3-phosphate synthase [Candidatus Woesearchaeota archaeon]